MTVQDAALPPATPSASTAPRRHVRAAAVAALGVYLVVALSRIIETMFYVLGNYAHDAVTYLRYMLPSVAPEWFLSPLPFALSSGSGSPRCSPFERLCPRGP